MRRPAPLWLARPTRFAALSAPAARIGLAFAVLLMVATGLALDLPAAQPAAIRADVGLYEAIVDSIRHGGDYYAVTADALRSDNAVMHPFTTFRLPTLAVVEAILPPWTSLALLWALAIGVAVAWYGRLRAALVGTGPHILLAILLAAGLAMLVRPEWVVVHEVWAGLLVALSLALRRSGRWLEPVAIALTACLIRETVALYVAIMAVLALAEGERRESVGWAVALGVLAIALSAHAHAVARVVQPLDPASPDRAAMLGFGVFVQGVAATTALAALPLWLGAPLVGLALIGWASWREPLALRALATFALYAAAVGILGRADSMSWAFLVAPTLVVGLAFVPDALRDLLAAARDRRRITVRRITR